jgi:hypothetical protein
MSYPPPHDRRRARRLRPTIRNRCLGRNERTGRAVDRVVVVPGAAPMVIDTPTVIPTPVMPPPILILIIPQPS